VKLGDWIAIICFAIALVILWQFRQILLLVFTAIVLSIALNSLVRRIQNFAARRETIVKRGQAVFLSLVLVLLFGTLFVGLVVPPFVKQFQQLIDLIPVGWQQFLLWIDRTVENPPPWLDLEAIEMPDFSDFTRQVGPLAGDLLGNFFTFFSNSLGVLLQVLLVTILTIMLLANPTSYRDMALRLFPSFYRRRADEIFTACEASLLNWMGGIVINSLFVATLSAIGLVILNVQFVFAHALLAGVFNFIPNIGPTASAIFPVSVALLDNPLKALAVIVVYVVIQNLESYWFSPMVMQKQVSLLPAVTLTAQIFFATFLGLMGLILALPLAVVSKTWIEEALLKDVFDRWSSRRFPTPPATPVLPKAVDSLEDPWD